MSSTDSHLVNYQPSIESIKFIAFIRACNIEDNANAEIHYKLADKYFSTDKQILIEAFRGSAKSSLMEWFVIYIAAKGDLPNFGKVEFIAFVGDSMENGTKNFFRNIAGKIDRSDLLKTLIKIKRKTDSEMELVNADGVELNMKGYGASALSLDTRLYTDNGYTTIGDCNVGDMVYGPDGKMVAITHKSEIFNKPSYKLSLVDGRELILSDDHINNVLVRTSVDSVNFVEKNLTTAELLKLPLKLSKDSNPDKFESMVYIKNTQAVEYTEKELPIDPYLFGYLLESASFQDDKFIPVPYMFGSIEQRIELLRGLMDSDGTLDGSGMRIRFTHTSKQLVEDVASLVRSIGGYATISDNVSTSNHPEEGGSIYHTTFIDTDINIFKFKEKADRFVCSKRPRGKVAVSTIEECESVPTQCIAVDSKDHLYLAGDYVVTHNTNIRGVRYKGARPDIVILDDITTNDAISSETIQNTINNNFFKSIIPALHPTKFKIFFIGTPISERDLIHQLSSNPEWVTHKFPIAEKFPVDEKDFKGNWIDRFPYAAVKAKYDMYLAAGKAQDFYQEYMLEITDLSTLLVDEEDVQWFDPSIVMKNRSMYNFYIATDFAVSTKQSADFSTIGVFAVSSNDDWLLVDGICKRQEMQSNIEDLFRLVRKWKPLSVGIESSGQQGGFISIIREMMMKRNNWFTFAKKRGSKDLGIRPVKDKVSRFVKGVQPKFKQNKIWLPKPELLTPIKGELHTLVTELVNELSKFTLAGGVKALAYDDALDLLNQLSEMELYTPSGEFITESGETVSNSFWGDEDDDSEDRGSTIF